MEIDITNFVQNEEPYLYASSRAEWGDNVGPMTWANAVRQGAHAPLLQTPEALEALRHYVKGFGAWSEAEIAAWTNDECNALFIQLISGDLREMESLCSDEDGEIDWKRAEELAQQGTIHGNIYPGDDGRFYYSLSD